MVSFFTELKRRNVFKVGVAYAITAWLLIQMTDIVAPALRLPDWTVTFIIYLLIIGFPLALFLAWAYELTPEGIKPANQVGPEESIESESGRKLNVLIFGLLIGAVVGAGSIWLLKKEDTPDEDRVAVQTELPIPGNTTKPDSTEDEITQLEKFTEDGDWEAAYSIARELEKMSPAHPRLLELWPRFSSAYAISTNPAGARIFRSAYGTQAGDWEDLGTAPLEKVRLPRGLSLMRYELEGYEPVLRTHLVIEFGGGVLNETVTRLPPVILDTEESLPPGRSAST